MATRRVEDVEPDEIVQTCMSGTAFKLVTRFLESRRLTVYPFDDEGDVPAFMIGISDELAREL